MVTQVTPLGPETVTPLGPLQDVVKGLREAGGRENGELAEAERQMLLQNLKQAGAAALPALLRSLLSSASAEADWAAYLLRELSGPKTRSKIVERLNALLVDPKLGDDSKARVLGLLADLRAPVPERVVLNDPDALLHRSVGELLRDLDSPAALSEALDMIFEQVPEAEFENFLIEVVQHGGAAAQPLLAGLVADSRTPRSLAKQLVQWVRPMVDPLESDPLENSFIDGNSGSGEGLSLARTSASHPHSAKGHGQLRSSQRTSTQARVPRMQRALRLLSHGQLVLAHEELRALRAQRQDDPAVCSAFGLCLLRLGQPDAALEHLERAATLAPTLAAHAWNAAVAAHLTDRPGRCYGSLRQYLSCRDEREGAWARQQAAAALCAEFQRLMAETYPGTSIEHVLESEALFEGAYVALHDARYTAAVEGFRAVLERLPTHPASWRNLGFAYLAQRRPREAARCFSRVLRLDSGRHLARADLE